MPVLARLVEEAGIPTVVVTMMPDIAAQYRLSRIVGVQFPYGHPFGMPGDRAMQRRVAQTAVDLLEGADEPGARVDLDIEWPVERKQAYKDWQPPVPSPIVQVFLDRLAATRAAGRDSRGSHG